MKVLGLIIGVLALGAAGMLGYFGHEKEMALKNELADANSLISSLQSDLEDREKAHEGLKAEFESYSETVNDRLDELKSQDTSNLSTMQDRLASLDEAIKNKLEEHVTKGDLPYVFEDYRNRMIDKASKSVVYVVRPGGGAGSGFFINDDGQALTNCHVVGDSDVVNLMTWDEHWVKADVIARDAASDLAVLQIIEDDLEDLKQEGALPGGSVLADSDKIEVGDFVFAMGAPHNMTQTVNAGQVSNIARFLPGLPILDKVSGLYNLYLQIDAGVMPGNSGGPSFNIDGEVIGVNTRANHQNESEGFVVPINFAMDRVKSMLERDDKTNHYNTIGFDLNPYLTQFRKELKGKKRLLPKGYKSAMQAGRVFTDSPAYAKGFRTGDFLLEINGERVDINVAGDVVDYRKLFAFGEPGKEFKIKVKHMGKYDHRTGKVTKEGEEEEITLKILGEEDYVLPVKINTLLVYTNILSEDDYPEGYEGGVKVVDGFNQMDNQMLMRSRVPRAVYGLVQGDVIVEVEGKDIENIGDLTGKLNSLAKARRVPSELTVIRGSSKIKLKPQQQQQRRPSQQQKPRTNPPKPKKRPTEIF